MPEAPEITRLEQLILSSAPARAEVEHGGWLVRYTANDVKRARSVVALCSPRSMPDKQIAWCEALYEEAGLPALFRMSPASQPATLDEALERRGYELLEPTQVHVLGLSDGVPVSAQRHEVAPVAPHLWVNAVGNFRHASLAERQSHLWRLNVLGESAHLLAAYEDGIIVGSGAVVMDDGYAGILDMHTREEYRGRGVASSVLTALMAYAASAGAHTAWLAVLAANEPARGLYAKFGFEPVYQYWYRQKPASTTQELPPS
jgi:ribosomal protein S18 acetylase RimI-like enzyme